ncbi:MAG: hypothetical protein E7J22_09070 [Clostridium perfringens]|nr:hypothetical protein [Clostridium perfringens]
MKYTRIDVKNKKRSNGHNNNNNNDGKIYGLKERKQQKREK